MKKFIFTSALLILITSSGQAQVEISGLADFVFKNSQESDYSNTTFKKFSNFHSVRTRLFFDAAVSEKNYVFTQLLVDDYSVSLYGAYIRFNEVYKNYLNIQLGFIPTPVGSFGPRTYSDKNPLIGTPLLYNYHSNFLLSNDVAAPVDDFLAAKNSRSNFGLPIIYDACWNSGAEFYGSAGKFDYSLGVLTGSLGKPTMEQVKDIPQFTTRLTYYFSPNLIIGVNGFYGPYLFEGGYGGSLPDGKKVADYINKGAGYDLYFGYYLFEFFSEMFYSDWDHPNYDNLEALSGYFEAKYKFSPGWYLAGRYGFFQPGDIRNSSGLLEPWDYTINRYEYGIGYRPGRATTIKLVNQINSIPDNSTLDHDLYALQVSVAFR